MSDVEWVSTEDGGIFIRTDEIIAVRYVGTSDGVATHDLILKGGSILRIHEERSAEELAGTLLSWSDMAN